MTATAEVVPPPRFDALINQLFCKEIPPRDKYGLPSLSPRVQIPSHPLSLPIHFFFLSLLSFFPFISATNAFSLTFVADIHDDDSFAEIINHLLDLDFRSLCELYR